MTDQLVHVDWYITPAEWGELKSILLANQTEFVDKLLADRALGE
jgi:hypothetical protein